jgi:hypothetical protein
METFGNWREAAIVAEQWRKFYNLERPHSSLGYQTRDEFKRDWKKLQRLLENETRKKLTSPVAQDLGSVKSLGQLYILRGTSTFSKFTALNLEI